MVNSYITEIEKQRTINLIVICYAIDEFEKFDKDLMKLMSLKNNELILSEIAYIHKGKKSLFSKKEKEFCKRHKLFLELLDKYGSLDNFLWDNYYVINTHKELIQFVKYIKKNKDKIQNIIYVLKTLHDLGFEKILFDESFNFTENTYTISKNIQDNLELVYLDNLKAIPNYDEKIVKYKTKGSNFKITLPVIENKVINNPNLNTIILNSLIFDPERLPKNLDKENTFDKLVELTSNVSKENKIIKDTLDLRLGIEDLNTIYNNLLEKITNIDDITKKEELKSLLKQIKIIINNMQTISDEHNQEILLKNINITKEILHEEYKIYKKSK